VKSKEVVTGLQDKLTDGQKALEEMEGGGKMHGKLQAKIEEIEKMLRVEKEVERNLSVWGVVLYDESECGLLMSKKW